MTKNNEEKKLELDLKKSGKKCLICKGEFRDDYISNRELNHSFGFNIFVLHWNKNLVHKNLIICFDCLKKHEINQNFLSALGFLTLVFLIPRRMIYENSEKESNLKIAELLSYWIERLMLLIFLAYLIKEFWKSVSPEFIKKIIKKIKVYFDPIREVEYWAEEEVNYLVRNFNFLTSIKKSNGYDLWDNEKNKVILTIYYRFFGNRTFTKIFYLVNPSQHLINKYNGKITFKAKWKENDESYQYIAGKNCEEDRNLIDDFMEENN
ncbi:MAG: hypothetical protein AD073_000306 [Mycoplasmataceae bacterium]|nr:MAG: hypothetical protein AD073_000306 [Mycoplasmataceae bacterium]